MRVIRYNIRQAGAEQTDAEDHQDSPDVVELFQRTETFPQRPTGERLDIRDSPVRPNSHGSEENGEEEEACSPVEDPRGNTTGQTSESETQRVACTEAGEGDILSLRGRGVCRAHNSNRWRNGHR